MFIVLTQTKEHLQHRDVLSNAPLKLSKPCNRTECLTLSAPSLLGNVVGNHQFHFPQDWGQQLSCPASVIQRHWSQICTRVTVINRHVISGGNWRKNPPLPGGWDPSDFMLSEFTTGRQKVREVGQTIGDSRVPTHILHIPPHQPHSLTPATLLSPPSSLTQLTPPCLGDRVVCTLHVVRTTEGRFLYQ